ncbi:MAG: nucleotidyltransferase domain-containing protein [Butyrivibrio sp.]|nr:nucleotidyltransferase domain-containing protein [Butyrivibrio sp.]MBR1642148.1 nucleotidyltransferase domain-containing protein [Butyrivibrio sp.]
MCKMVQFTDGKYVADIKLHHIKNISEMAKKASSIRRIMLFGSSIEERCTDISDIDIAVFGDKTKGSYIDSNEFKAFKRSLFSFDWDQDYDILYFKENAANRYDIMKDINRGIEIYRRSAE